jgi:hypothetical protein
MRLILVSWGKCQSKALTIVSAIPNDRVRIS